MKGKKEVGARSVSSSLKLLTTYSILLSEVPRIFSSENDDSPPKQTS